MGSIAISQHTATWSLHRHHRNLLGVLYKGYLRLYTPNSHSRSAFIGGDWGTELYRKIYDLVKINTSSANGCDAAKLWQNICLALFFNGTHWKLHPTGPTNYTETFRERERALKVWLRPPFPLVGVTVTSRISGISKTPLKQQLKATETASTEVYLKSAEREGLGLTTQCGFGESSFTRPSSTWEVLFSARGVILKLA